MNLQSNLKSDKFWLSYERFVPNIRPGCVVVGIKREQRVGKQASSMVLSIVGRTNAIIAIKGFLLFAERLKVTQDLHFNGSIQCTNCLSYGHHHCQCKSQPACASCAGPDKTHLHQCSRPDCKTKGSTCLHITLCCVICKSTTHEGNSKDRHNQTAAKVTTADQRNQIEECAGHEPTFRYLLLLFAVCLSFVFSHVYFFLPFCLCRCV